MISAVNNVNFNGRYTVRVPKESFNSPNDPIACEDDMDIAVQNAINPKKKFFRKKNPSCVFLEAPIYASVASKSEYSLGWINAHTGIRVAPPKSKEYHTFTVLTKDEAKQFYKGITGNNLVRITNQIASEIYERSNMGKTADDIWALSRVYQIFGDILDKCTKNSKKHETITIDSLDNIQDAIDKMDV